MRYPDKFEILVQQGIHFYDVSKIAWDIHILKIIHCVSEMQIEGVHPVFFF